MKAEVSVSGGTTPAIEVNSGLRQGCTIAPTLFNLYFNMVITCWRDRCQPFGVDIFYKCSGKLTGERTRSPSSFTATELLFADDAAAVSTSRESMERAALVLEEVTSEWGLTVSVSKTKLLVAGVNCEDTDLQPIYIRGGAIEAMTEFKYLGTIIEANGSIQREVEDRIPNPEVPKDLYFNDLIAQKLSTCRVWGVLGQRRAHQEDSRELSYQQCLTP